MNPPSLTDHLCALQEINKHSAPEIRYAALRLYAAKTGLPIDVALHLWNLYAQQINSRRVG